MISPLQEALAKTFTLLYQYESSLLGSEGPAKIRPLWVPGNSFSDLSGRNSFSASCEGISESTVLQPYPQLLCVPSYREPTVVMGISRRLGAPRKHNLHTMVNRLP